MGMLDVNTDRAFFMIGSIIVAAVIIAFLSIWIVSSGSDNIVDNGSTTLDQADASTSYVERMLDQQGFIDLPDEAPVTIP